jgi:restriction system protein
LTRWVDDYVEEVAVGAPLWALLFAFGVGFPILLALVSWLFHIHYPTASWGLIVFLGMVIGAAFWQIARQRERYRSAALGRSGDLAALRDLSWQDFEIVVGELIRRQGYTVKERGGFHADGGVDLIAEGRKGRIAIQCKQWRSWSVKESQVKELYATVKAGGFREGWLVTCGHFNDGAQAWAKGKELRLVDGVQLTELQRGTALPAIKPAEISQAASAAPHNPVCPECGLAMRRQTNKEDHSTFWGCSGYSVCRFTAEDPPTTSENVHCPRGHPMVLRNSKRGVAFWGCSDATCRRKRLNAKPTETID